METFLDHPGRSPISRKLRKPTTSGAKMLVLGQTADCSIHQIARPTQLVAQLVHIVYQNVSMYQNHNVSIR